LFGLRLSTERLELRLPTEDEVVSLAASAPHDLETDPAWPAPPDVPRPVSTAVLQWYWRALGEWRVDHWRLPFGVWCNGELVGFQELEAEKFAALRTVESSSWLSTSARGIGIGKEMRAAVLALAFDHLGATVATSGAWEWNGSSLGVSRALGYVDNGWFLHEHLGRVGKQQRVVLERAEWHASAWPATVTGLDPCFAWFGVSPKA
jgi:RimJ/RimL family protein N-acetyltransferase